jgi:hypothetical protein
MDNCKVCSKSYTMGRSSRNYSYEGFCSRYCYEYDQQGLSTKDGEWPAVEVICQTCADPFPLIRQHNQYAHSHFCSIDCRKAMRNHDRKGERDYHYLLPVYQSPVGLTAADVSEKNKYRWHGSKAVASASYVLNLWHKRGILHRYKTRPSRPYIYEWSSKHPTVKAMITRE